MLMLLPLLLNFQVFAGYRVRFVASCVLPLLLLLLLLFIIK